MTPLERALDLPYAQIWLPNSGWHDDHRAVDGTPDYRPAVQQVQEEFEDFINELYDLEDFAFGACLQLGAGMTDAPHGVWRCLFDRVVTVDWRGIFVDDTTQIGADTRSDYALTVAAEHAPYDLLWIDADHSFAGAQSDHARYARLVRSGGVIAFHDALPRAAYPEVEVHAFLKTLADAHVRVLGEEVGVGWYRKT